MGLIRISSKAGNLKGELTLYALQIHNMWFRFIWDDGRSLPLPLGRGLIFVERTVVYVVTSAAADWEQCSSAMVLPEVMVCWGRRDVLVSNLADLCMALAVVSYSW